ncbi:MAG: ATP-dependent metalloprotease, partial [Pseudomonadales bacterium]
SIIDSCYATANQLLEDNREKLEKMAQALMDYETIDADQIEDIMSGNSPRPPANWTDDDGDQPGAGESQKKSSGAGSSIGGAAGEH